MKKYLWMIYFLILPFTYAKEKEPQNVILITVDGVRFQEIFSYGHKINSKRLPNLHGLQSDNKLWAYNRMKISNKPAISLPGYYAIMSGKFEKKCKRNLCPNIEKETFFDYFAKLNIPSKKLAAFASWERLELALESNPGNITRNVAFAPFSDSEATVDEENWINNINAMAQGHRPPWGGSRYDRFTFELAKYYIKKHRPRITYIQLVDTDEYAHLGERKKYEQAIKTFDQWTSELLELLASLGGDYGRNTSVVITTDHGRGRGFLWKHHSKEYLSAKRVWALIIPSQEMLETKQITKSDIQLSRQHQVRSIIHRFME
jgi:predicted AlkP superfamily pyrophosphatase or phosphodiesterase